MLTENKHFGDSLCKDKMFYLLQENTYFSRIIDDSMNIEITQQLFMYRHIFPVVVYRCPTQHLQPSSSGPCDR
jgi:hypothetical protein